MNSIKFFCVFAAVCLVFCKETKTFKNENITSDKNVKEFEFNITNSQVCTTYLKKYYYFYIMKYFDLYDENRKKYKYMELIGVCFKFFIFSHFINFLNK